LFCSPEGPRRDFAAPKQIDPEADHLDHLSASVVAKNFRHGWRGASASATLTRLLARSSKNSVVAKRTADRTAKINDAISEAIDIPHHDCD
jgi:hypothetical protein